jgi:flagellar basal-body rod modification protein FlgD
MTTTPVTGLAGTQSTQTASSQTPAQPKTSASDPLTNKATFLQLLVAQLKNQNPLSPADGIQFVTQLAQFSSLEQSTEMRDDLDAIRQQLAAAQQTAAQPTTKS